MKIILWAVLIIFLIGLLVVTGVFKMMSSGPKITRIFQSLILLRSCHVHCFI